MNKFHTISRVLAVAVVVFVGSMKGKGNPYYEYKFNPDLRGAHLGGQGRWSFFTGLVTEEIFQKDEIAKKAAVQSLGFMADKKLYENVSTTDAKELAQHFAMNYAIRKGMQLAADKGYSFDYIANKCDRLPESLGAYVNPIVRFVAEQATRPEALMFFAGIVADAFSNKSGNKVEIMSKNDLK